MVHRYWLKLLGQLGQVTYRYLASRSDGVYQSAFLLPNLDICDTLKELKNQNAKAETTIQNSKIFNF